MLALMTPRLMLQLALRRLVGTVALCLFTGFVVYMIRGRDFGVSLLYAFTIGLQISLYTFALHAAVGRWRRSRRPGNATLQRGVLGWVWLLPCVVVGALAGYVGGLALGNLLSGASMRHVWDEDATGAWQTVGFTLLMSLVGALFYVWQFRLHLLQLEQAHAARQAAEARLALLQSQLEPHMLFNTLAHLRVLIRLDPHEAQAMLDQLIAFLRATLQASRAAEHALSDEFDRLADYLALMRRRMGERLQVSLNLPDALTVLTIPPLLLQPLVENAIKHGLEPHLDGGRLSVSARRDGNRLCLEVVDTGTGMSATSELPAVGTGFGLAQVRERLAQRYGGAASFHLEPRPGGGSIARIHLPLP
jgi:signal transduction histidine kinase